MKTWLARSLVFVVLIVGGVLLITALQRSILFPHQHVPLPPPHMPQPPGLIRVDVAHADGRSEGWFLPGRGVSAGAPGPVVFHAHGNGELIDYAAPGLAPYRARGISVALLEYRGYGRSDGSPSEEALLADAEAFYDQIIARPDVRTDATMGHGRSLGGGVISGLSTRRPLKALVLESTFRSVTVIARRFMLPGFLVADPFDNEAAVQRFAGPVLVIHGVRDEIIPVEHGRRLAELARDARIETWDAGHNDLAPDARYWQAIDDLVARALR